jgi:acetyltransferase
LCTELAVIVSDAYQNLGLGSELVRRLLDVARQEKLPRLVATILPENRAMQKVFENLGFAVRYSKEEEVLEAEINL